MVIFSLLILILFAGIGVIHRALKPTQTAQYTREHFAFLALKTLSAMILLGLGAAFSSTFSVQWLNDSLGLSFNASPPTTMVLMLWLAAVLILAAFCLYLYKNWQGQQSENHYQRQQKQEPALKSFLPDAALYWKYRTQIASSPLAKHQVLADQDTILPKARRADLSWQQQARELIQLSEAYKNYVFQATEHDYSCYLGQHRHTKEQLVLACWQDYPSKQVLDKLIRYIKKIEPRTQTTNIRFLIALKTGDYQKDTRYQGYKIAYTSEAILLDKLVDFQNYYNVIQARVQQKNRLNHNACLLDIYTEASYSKQKNGRIYPHIEQLLSDWLAEKSYRQLALLGEYGYGKSTTSLVFCQHLIALIKQHHKESQARSPKRIPKHVPKHIPKRIPILFELRGRSPRTLSEEDLFAIWAAPYGINVHALLKLLQAGRLLIIFEGFDEVDLAGDKDIRLNHFKALWRLCYQHAKILITGRPNFFFDEAEQDLALAVRTPSVERPYCELVYLAPFNLAQIKHSLRQTDPHIRQQILALAQANKNFLDVISRPSVLHQISHIWHSEQLSANDAGDINAALITAHFIHHSIQHAYDRQAEKIHTHSLSASNNTNFMLLNTAERAYFMAGIAIYMWVNKLPNQINGDALNAITEQLIAVIPDLTSAQIDALSNEPKKPLRQRIDIIHNKHTMLQQIQTDVRSCGLLERDPSKTNHFRFGHKSFMEFLCGQVFAYSFLSSQKEFKQNIPSIEAISLANRLKMPIGFSHLAPEMAQSASEVIIDQIKPIAKDQQKKSSAVLLGYILPSRVQGMLKSSLNHAGLCLRKHHNKTDKALTMVEEYKLWSFLLFAIIYFITLSIFDYISLENLSLSSLSSLLLSFLSSSLPSLLVLLVLSLLSLLLSFLLFLLLVSLLSSSFLLLLLLSSLLLSLLPQNIDILPRSLIIMGFILPTIGILLYGFLVKIWLQGIFNGEKNKTRFWKVSELEFWYRSCKTLAISEQEMAKSLGSQAALRVFHRYKN